MNLKTKLLREFLWLGGIAIVAGIITVIVTRPWLGAFWVQPLPNTHGPVWINANPSGPWTWFLLVFFGLLILTALIRLILRLIRRKQLSQKA